MMKIFDSHAHYYDGRFFEEGVDTDALLSRLFSSDVGKIINVATNNINAVFAINMARRYKNMYTAIGIHPSDINKDADIDEELDALRSFLINPANKAVALGEIGLDYHFEPYDEKLQRIYFDRQLTMSEELGLPAVVHVRDSHGDSFDVIKGHKNAFGVIHSYSGSLETAKEYIKRGWYISFSGTVTFKKARKVADVASSLPHDRVLVETDAPYLAPHPNRGKINHSGYLVYTIGKIAELWNTEPDEVAEITYNNAMRLFSIKE